MDRLQDQLAAYDDLLIWVSCISVLMFVASLLLVPYLIGRAREDLFVREPAASRGPLALLGKIAKNLLGAVLLVAGLLMLVLPGQGLLMILLALLCLDLPGKRALVRRIVQNPSVWKALRYFRERAHKPPFEHP